MKVSERNFSQLGVYIVTGKEENPCLWGRRAALNGMGAYTTAQAINAASERYGWMGAEKLVSLLEGYGSLAELDRAHTYEFFDRLRAEGRGSRAYEAHHQTVNERFGGIDPKLLDFVRSFEAQQRKNRK